MNNLYMKAQCRTMAASLDAFSLACGLAALEDDGILSRKEETQLRKLRAAVKRFQRELARLMEGGAG